MSDHDPFAPPPPGGQPGARPGGYPSPGPYGPPPDHYPPPGHYGGPGYGYDPAAPFGYDRFGRIYSEKSKVVAALFQLLLGVFGAGRWYTGHIGMAIAQLLTLGGCGLWAFIDGILFLVKDDRTDAAGRVLRS
ncbi:TM2 domain-containing protein [Streptomyces radicis]|uniref:TM2 domain-containing protein n=1 Tax=Streptomyces radicis TaxID=1750517 RepID=A0A3A9WU02_9ACTN|nr:TM2 domain-containing protein [Streptomyces radicis]RKN09577.1 TM2 domain-containing protein [Streptomyces radicis]RKN23255.1 TM2 domain-containing protein [Streptomyces radicis]